MGTGNIVLTSNFLLIFRAIYILLGGKDKWNEIRGTDVTNTERSGSLWTALTIYARCDLLASSSLHISIARIKFNRLLLQYSFLQIQTNGADKW